MMRGLEEYLEAICRRLLGSEGCTRGGEVVSDVHQSRLSSLDEATLSRCLPASVAAYETIRDFGEIKPYPAEAIQTLTLRDPREDAID